MHAVFDRVRTDHTTLETLQFRLNEVSVSVSVCACVLYMFACVFRGAVLYTTAGTERHALCFPSNAVSTCVFRLEMANIHICALRSDSVSPLSLSSCLAVCLCVCLCVDVSFMSLCTEI